MRIFADTNVLFDIFAQREPFREAAFKLIIMQMFGDVEIWTAPQSYLNIFYVLSKTQPAADVQKALSASLEHVNLCTTSHIDMQAALQAGWDDAEDALIAISCKNLAAEYLLTRDSKQEGFKHMGIPALTPEAFLELWEKEHGVLYNEVDLSQEIN